MPHSRPFLCCLSAAALLLPLAPGLAAQAAEPPRGEEIYRKQCASCHGTHGEGSKKEYPHPLAGDRTVTQLARLIGKTMPKDDPGTCTGEDADEVAAYIYDAFYSQAARERRSRRASSCRG